MSVKFVKKIICIFCSCVLISCDEGKIYPDNTVETGRTVTVTVSFQGLDAWPKKNYLSLIAEDVNGNALTTKRFIKPSSENEKVTLTLYNLKDETKTINIGVISNGLNLIYNYYTYQIDFTQESTTLPVEKINLASLKRIQQQVFNTSCIACHGGSDKVSGNLYLTEEKAYGALVNVPAPRSEDGKMYVKPSAPEESFFLDILENDILYYNHTDIFNGTEKQEITGLIKAWIEKGAENN